MIAYFDTSAIVKFFLDEPGADVADRIWNASDRTITGWLTYAETRAALAAARRAARIRQDWGRLRRSVDVRFQEVALVTAGEEIVRLAGDLADRRHLHGYDAVHLATALAIGPEVTFVSWDAELSRAAADEGLQVAGSDHTR